ncbi:hypothetical protein DPMN_093469 [Dreissena polymorpha]|uniref:Uncharacterized protein n=1 Tax=Dreissena polymorpha TaxID=45954 RepID=A0A9D4L5J3_DREPO|nr:hypothetical protein DPMN_093469 [Dreissena polymorpha]
MRSLPVPVALAVCILSRATWQVATKPVNHVEDYIGRKGIPTINDQLQNNELHSSSLPVGQGESMMPGFVDV